jgi:hypothetical protein
MNNIESRIKPGIKPSIKTAIVSILSIGLIGTALAAPSRLQTYDIGGSSSTPTVSFSTDGFSSTNKAQDSSLDVYVPGWSLGAIGFDVGGSNLKIASVEAAQGISVTLKDASGGASNDRLKFVIKADANTPKGIYPVQVMLENKKFGEQGVVTILAEVK